MPSAALVGIVYCLLIAAVSLLGGLVALALRLTHKRMELALSFVAGAMLGVAVLHLLPHAILLRAEAAATRGEHPGHDLVQPVALWLLAGFLVMFLIERFFCFHHHEAPEHAGADEAGLAHDHGHDDGHGHGRQDQANSDAHHHSRHRLTWAGAAIGLTLHSLMEGVALAAAVVAEQHAPENSHGSPWSIVALAGLGTFIVIALHKPFDSMTLGTLMAAAGWSARARHVANSLFSLVVPIGGACFALGFLSAGASENRGLVVSAALAFSAGTFLCISLSDLLPELQFHQHDRVKLSFALLLGLALAWAVAVIEGRMHGH